MIVRPKQDPNNVALTDIGLTASASSGVLKTSHKQRIGVLAPASLWITCKMVTSQFEVGFHHE
jgi:hypothetical protein